MSDETFAILELHCNTDKSVAATARRETWAAPGALLHSADGGLTWSIAVGGDNLVGIAPRFFTDPRDDSAGNGTLIVAGYKSTALIQWTYQLAGWMRSPDLGRTWTAIPARLPAVGSRDPLGWPPPLVVVDNTGRLATIRKAPAPVLLLSDDRGTTWQETRLPELDHVNDLRTDGRGRLIVVGWASSPVKGLGMFRTLVLHSDDSGKTWFSAMDKPGVGNCNPHVVGSPDAAMLINIGCSARGDRHYFFSQDGGRSWHDRRFFRYAYGSFQQVIAVDDKRWLALSAEKSGEKSSSPLFAWISDDGGASWRGNATGYTVNTGGRDFWGRPILVLPRGVVLAYVGDGHVLRSANRGESWQLIDTGLPRNGTSSLGAQCTDRHGLVVLGGSQGMVVRSLDSGLTWDRGRLPSGNP